MTDEIVRHAFSHGFRPEHIERFSAYWAEARCGPEDSARLYGGESEVVRLHRGNGSHPDMDDRGIACFD